MGEIAHRQDGAALPAPDDRFGQTMMMVREALLNPNINPENAKVMAELLNSQEDRALAAQFNRDLNAALFEMPVVTKAGIIIIPGKDGKPARTQGRFAKFEDIDRVVRPILMRHNLAIRFEVGDSGGTVTVRPILSHTNGHTERGEAMRLPIDSSGSKNNVQGAGSAVSYGKRYTMCALLNIITEGSDDDGSLGKYDIEMPNERAVTVLEQAEEAHAAGVYQDWYARQGVKDRAWLVSSGKHTEFGGKALAGPAGDPPPRTPAPRGGEPDTSTPEGWTTKYERDVAAARDLMELAGVQQRAAKALDKLKATDSVLHARAVDAGTMRAAELRDNGDD